MSLGFWHYTPKKLYDMLFGSCIVHVQPEFEGNRVDDSGSSVIVVFSEAQLVQ